MKIVFDSSVLIAGTHDAHPHHRRAIVWIDAVLEQRATGMVAWHGLAEVWSVLTRLPAPARLSSEQALRLVRRIQAAFQLQPMDSAVYEEALQRCSDRALRSGVIFDALHLVCAERAGADALLTFNGADFLRLTSPTSPRVLVPPDPPAVTI